MRVFSGNSGLELGMIGKFIVLSIYWMANKHNSKAIHVLTFDGIT